MDNGKQMRFDEGELELIRTTFKDNPALLKLLRKVFLPEYDPKAPLGQAFDLWMTLQIQGMTPDVAYVHMLARNQVITHVEQQLLQLDALAGIEPENPKQIAERAKKNGTE